MGVSIYPKLDPNDGNSDLNVAVYNINENIIPGMSLNKIFMDQDSCSKIKQVQELVTSNTPVSEVPKRLQLYKEAMEPFVCSRWTPSKIN